jgi:CHAD domain-containing protein
MPYRLTQGESVDKGMRRIVTEELESAVSSLRNNDDSARDEGIHEARKSIKKLRAVVRLLMPGLGPAGTNDNIALRDTGRALSTLRDAAALIETVEVLSNQYFADPAMEQLAVVRSALRRRMEDTVRGEDCRTVTGGAMASLKCLKKHPGKWQIAGGTFCAIAPGLENTYRLGRRRFKLARKNPTPENLHSLRKRVKDHWYHVRLLEGAWRLMSNGHSSRDKELRDLQDWLGEHHNLTVLRDAITADPAAFGGKKIIPAVLALISRAQDELQQQSLVLAARIYAGKPKLHMQEIGVAWDAWQGVGSVAVPVQAPLPAAGAARHRGSAA